MCQACQDKQYTLIYPKKDKSSPGFQTFSVKHRGKMWMALKQYQYIDQEKSLMKY